MSFHSENDLFWALKDLVPDLTQSQDQFESYDCYSVKHNVYVELKCRRSHYDDLLIERSKYNALMERAKGWIPFYICSTPEGVYSFNLKELRQPVWTDREMPQTTDFDRNDKVTKSVGFLHIDKSEAAPGGGIDSALLDLSPHPSGSSFQDFLNATLPVGGLYSDPLTNVTISSLGQNDENIIVKMVKQIKCFIDFHIIHCWLATAKSYFKFKWPFE